MSSLHAVKEAVLAHDWSAAQELLELTTAQNDSERVSLTMYKIHIGRGRADYEAATKAASALLDELAPHINPQVALAALGVLERAGDMEQAWQVKSKWEGLLDPSVLNVLAARHSTATDMRHRLGSASVNIIPLGQNCLPADLFWRWGLGPLVVEGPFQAGAFQSDAAAICIEDELRAFEQKDKFLVRALPSNIEGPFLTPYNMFFNHEAGPYWLDGGMERFFALYGKRVAAFRRALSGENLLFVLARTASIDLERLLAAITSKTMAKNWRLAVFDHIPSRPVSVPPQFSDRVSVLSAPYPTKTYAWHDPLSFNTGDGLDFERALVGFCTPFIENMAKHG